MSTTSLTVRYRPLRIGFVIPRDDLHALATVAETNSLLWGGIYNPILPAGYDPQLLAQWVALFNLDLLTPIGDTQDVKAAMETYRYLRTPHHFADDIFFEDWRTKKFDLGVLDILHIIDHYWESDFRHKPADFKSNCVLVDWAADEPCSYLLALSFGGFTTDKPLKFPFRDAFRDGLRAGVETLNAAAPLPAFLAERISPIALTRDRLQQYGGSLREDDGIYIGGASNFDDLVAFWNLRAAGTQLFYLPHDHVDRFRGYIQIVLRQLDEIPIRPPLDREWIGVHWRDNSAVDAPSLMKQFEMRKRPLLCRYDPIVWNGLNVTPSQFYFSSHSVLANINRRHGRYTVSFALPPKPGFREDDRRDVDHQHLVAVVNPLVEFDYPDHTLKPPPLKGLDEFLSREITIDPWKLRTDPEGVALTIQLHDSAESLHPLPHQDLVRKLLELVGIDATLSTAGTLADRIVKQMREHRPLDACRVFKIRGVRRLLKELRPPDTTTWNRALRTIGQEGFDRFRSLYIESRKSPHLTPGDVLNFLITKEIIRPRLRWWPRLRRLKEDIRCQHCSLTSSVPLRAFEGAWSCPFCKNEEDLAARLATDFRGGRPEWLLARSGLFAKDNNLEGALPVILALLQLLRVLDWRFVYSTAMNLKIAERQCETDLVVLSYGHREGIEMALGECKDEGGVITEQDVANLRLAWTQFQASRITAYLIFAKTTDAFTQEELALFRALQRDHIPVILLTNRELEPYEPYRATETTVPRPYALSLSDMAHNSIQLYLAS